MSKKRIVAEMEDGAIGGEPVIVYESADGRWFVRAIRVEDINPGEASHE